MTFAGTNCYLPPLSALIFEFTAALFSLGWRSSPQCLGVGFPWLLLFLFLSL